ncbi:hypothetical protein C8R43DRAFT_964009 [Mycena crocata]|nr:hypothetical protein C8R43DRAFT_964009 [Mycena crocata]
MRVDPYEMVDWSEEPIDGVEVERIRNAQAGEMGMPGNTEITRVSTLGGEVSGNNGGLMAAQDIGFSELTLEDLQTKYQILEMQYQTAVNMEHITKHDKLKAEGRVCKLSAEVTRLQRRVDRLQLVQHSLDNLMKVEQERDKAVRQSLKLEKEHDEARRLSQNAVKELTVMQEQHSELQHDLAGVQACIQGVQEKRSKVQRHESCAQAEHEQTKDVLEEAQDHEDRLVRHLALMRLKVDQLGEEVDRLKNDVAVLSENAEGHQVKRPRTEEGYKPPGPAAGFTSIGQDTEMMSVKRMGSPRTDIVSGQDRATTGPKHREKRLDTHGTTSSPTGPQAQTGGPMTVISTKVTCLSMGPKSLIEQLHYVYAHKLRCMAVYLVTVPPAKRTPLEQHAVANYILPDWHTDVSITVFSTHTANNQTIARFSKCSVLHMERYNAPVYAVIIQYRNQRVWGCDFADNCQTVDMRLAQSAHLFKMALLRRAHGVEDSPVNIQLRFELEKELLKLMSIPGLYAQLLTEYKVAPANHLNPTYWPSTMGANLVEWRAVVLQLAPWGVTTVMIDDSYAFGQEWLQDTMISCRYDAGSSQIQCKPGHIAAQSAGTVRMKLGVHIAEGDCRKTIPRHTYAWVSAAELAGVKEAIQSIQGTPALVVGFAHTGWRCTVFGPVFPPKGSLASQMGLVDSESELGFGLSSSIYAPAREYERINNSSPMYGLPNVVQERESLRCPLRTRRLNKMFRKHFAQYTLLQSHFHGTPNHDRLIGFFARMTLSDASPEMALIMPTDEDDKDEDDNVANPTGKGKGKAADPKGKGKGKAKDVDTNNDDDLPDGHDIDESTEADVFNMPIADVRKHLFSFYVEPILTACLYAAHWGLQGA